MGKKTDNENAARAAQTEPQDASGAMDGSPSTGTEKSAAGAAESPAEAKHEWPEQCVILADGTKITASAGYDQDRTVWIWIDPGTGITLAEAFRVANNPSIMETITLFINGKESGKWQGFTRLYHIQQAESGRISIAMRKEG